VKRHTPSPKRFRIVLTGGPGGGKTTAADLFRREIGDRVVIVPEAATILFQGGFPRSREPRASRFAQTAIFHLQRHLEDVQAALFPSRALLCDRGTVDGAAYWPGETAEYFTAFATTLDAELARYDAVIFFETAALGGVSIEGGNPIRNESTDEAVKLDEKKSDRFIVSSHFNPLRFFASHGVPNTAGCLSRSTFTSAADLLSISTIPSSLPAPAAPSPLSPHPLCASAPK
jgi:predicted ATPase